MSPSPASGCFGISEMQWIRSEWTCRNVAIGQLDGRDADRSITPFETTAEVKIFRFFSTAGRESCGVKPRLSELPP